MRIKYVNMETPRPVPDIRKVLCLLATGSTMPCRALFTQSFTELDKPTEGRWPTTEGQRQCSVTLVPWLT